MEEKENFLIPSDSDSDSVALSIPLTYVGLHFSIYARSSCDQKAPSASDSDFASDSVASVNQPLVIISPGMKSSNYPVQNLPMILFIML